MSATADAAAIHDASLRLREAGAELRRRPARDVLAALGEVLEGWRDPGSPWRRALVERLPAATGFTPETVREGLAHALEEWTSSALSELATRELGALERLDAGAPAMVTGFEWTAVLLAGSIPMPSLLSILLPLALRSPVLAKCASRDPVTPELVARSLAEVDPALGRCVEVVHFDPRDDAATDAFLAAPCVAATGSDEVMAQVSRSVTPPRRLVLHGHRLSVAVVGNAASRVDRVGSVAERLAHDVAMWDQLGCLSPIAVFVVDPEPEGPDRVAQALASELAAAEARWPRGALDPAAAGAIRRERDAAEMRAASGRRVFVHASPGTAWTVVREDGPELRPAPLHRFVRVHPVSSLAALVPALAPLGPHLAAVALEGFGAATSGLARDLAGLGASRICRPGRLQAPALAWRRDGLPLLLPLARSCELSEDITH